MRNRALNTGQLTREGPTPSTFQMFHHLGSATKRMWMKRDVRSHAPHLPILRYDRLPSGPKRTRPPSSPNRVAQMPPSGAVATAGPLICSESCGSGTRNCSVAPVFASIRITDGARSCTTQQLQSLSIAIIGGEGSHS